MAGIEHSLISRIIETRDFKSVMRARVTEDFLVEPEPGEMFRFIFGWYHTHNTLGQVPSAEVMTARFPGFRFYATDESVAGLCEQLRHERLRGAAQKLGADVAELAVSSPKDAIAMMRAGLNRLSTIDSVQSEDMSLAQAATTLERDYYLRASMQGMTGLPYPWHVLNEALGGLHSEDLVYIYGRSKNYKSFVTMYMALFIYMVARRRVLYYTREMNLPLTLGRAACFLNRVDYDAFKQAKLQPEIAASVFQTLRELGEDEQIYRATHGADPYFLVTTDRNVPGGAGLGWLQSKLDEVQPDVLIVDGAYLMKDDRSGKRDIDWKAITHISQDLKRIVQDRHLIGIANWQSNRKGEGSPEGGQDETSYGDAIGQDCDLLMKTTKDKNPETGQWECIVATPLMRESTMDGFVINANCCTNFEWVRNFTARTESAKKQGNFKTKEPQRPGYRSPNAQQFAPPRG